MQEVVTDEVVLSDVYYNTLNKNMETQDRYDDCVWLAQHGIGLPVPSGHIYNQHGFLDVEIE